VVLPQNHWDDLSVVWPQKHWNGFFRFDLNTSGDGFFRFGLKIDGFGFSSLDLKIGSYDFVIWTSESIWWFLDLGMKTKRVMICQLRHKTDGMMKMTRGTRQDLATCFGWK
jgi:hypothetical protein